MEFEWDHTKSAGNLRKHGVGFDEAATVFGDSLAITYQDPDHSRGEERLITFGLSEQGRYLVVSHTSRPRIRIISARRMTRRERRIYEEN